MEIRINLLPDYRKEEIAKSIRFKLLIILIVVTLFIFLLFSFFLFGISQSLSMELNSTSLFQENSQNKDQLEKIKKFDNEFSQINSSAGVALKLEKDQLYWTNLLELLSAKITDGISITDLATKDYAVILAGHADNRDILMDYKDKLDSEECFSDVNLPLSNLVSKEDISFQIDFRIDKKCLNSLVNK